MISIVIPAYEQPGTGAKMLIPLLNSIVRQETNYEYEILVSDNSEGSEVGEICERFPVRYIYNPKKGASENFNHCFDNAKFDLIKPMCMDDAFYSYRGLNLFCEALKNKNWVISNSVFIRQNGEVYGKRNTTYNHNQFNRNLTGMPSVIGFKRNHLRFRDDLKTVCDMFFYYELFEAYGPPGVIREFTVASRYWAGSLSHHQKSRHQEEKKLLQEKGMIKI